MKARSWKRKKGSKGRAGGRVGRTLSTAAAAVGTRISSLNDKDNAVLQGQTPFSLARFAPRFGGKT